MRYRDSDYYRKDEAIEEPRKMNGMKVTSEFFKNINVRIEPSASGKIIAVLKVGTDVYTTGDSIGDFTPVILENGQSGYIMTKFLQPI